MTYTNLIADVPSFTARSDFTTAQLERFISLAEDKVSRMLRIAEMRHEVSQLGYANPKSTSVVFKTDREVLEPITIRAKNAAGDTLRVYEAVPNAVFRETRRSKSERSIWTPDPIASIPVTDYDGSTYGGKTGIETTNKSALVFCCAFRLNALPTKSYLISLPQLSNNDFFSVQVTSAGALKIETYSSGDQLSHTFTDFTIVANTQYALILVIDAPNSAVIAYLNDTKSADSPTFGNTDDIALNGASLAIAAANPATGGSVLDGQLTQIGLATYGTSMSSPIATFFDADQAATRRRIFDSNDAPVQYGTGRGYGVFGHTPLLWIPDGSCDKNFGTITGVEKSAGELRLYESEDDFGVISDLYGVLVNPGFSDGSEYFELSYYQEWPALTSTNDTHWLIDQHYDLYLYGCLAEAYDFLLDTEHEIAYREKFAGVIDSINRTNQRKLRGTGPYVRRNARRVTP